MQKEIRNMPLKVLTNRALKMGQRGMTLLEIMIVLVILGGIATILVTSVMGRLGSAKVKQARIQIGEYTKALDMYYTDCQNYPTTEEGLQALVKAPSSCSNWINPYVKKVNKDPWGNDLIYESSGGDYELKSLGKDRREGGDGENADISSKDI